MTPFDAEQLAAQIANANSPDELRALAAVLLHRAAVLESASLHGVGTPEASRRRDETRSPSGLREKVTLEVHGPHETVRRIHWG